jgi:serine/threonine protein phosphatase PrpC
MSSKHSIEITSAIRQMSAKQDHVCAGKGIDEDSGEIFDWVMLNDGHGTDSCIREIRGISNEKMSMYMGKSDPVAAIVGHIEDSNCVRPVSLFKKRESSGATAVILKCYSDRARCITIGDSQAVIFKDGALVHVTAEHNSANESERARVQELGYTFTGSSSIKVVSETKITSSTTEYMDMGDGTMLATTQALGHNCLTGYDPLVYDFAFDEGSSYKVVLASDGVFDMIMWNNENDINMLRSKSSSDICDWIVARWLQKWDAIYPSGQETSFSYTPEQCDDVSAATVEIRAVKYE